MQVSASARFAHSSPLYRRASALPEDRGRRPKETDINAEAYREAIEACHRCADSCDHCAAACLQEASVQAMARCIALDIDCAALCRLTAAMMARDSEHAMPIALVCAQLCEACVDECGQHDMALCRACAEACRRCAKACRGVSEQR